MRLPIKINGVHNRQKERKEEEKEEEKEIESLIRLRCCGYRHFMGKVCFCDCHNKTELEKGAD